MGNFNYVDTLTGTSIGGNQPIVAFLVEDDGPGFFSPYRLGSLPIRGTMSSDCDGIVPDRGQLSVDLAIRANDFENWQDIVLGTDSLMVMHASTWDHLMQVHGWTDDRAVDVDIVMNVYGDMHARLANDASLGGNTDLAVQDHDLFDISAYKYKSEDGTKTDLPAVAASLANNSRSCFSDRCRDWLQVEVREEMHAAWDSDGMPLMREMLEGLWDAEAFRATMLRLNRCIRPSTIAHDTNFQADQFAVALLAARQCGEQALGLAEAGGEGTGDTERLEGLLSQMDALRKTLSERLTAFDGLSLAIPHQV